MQLVWPTASSGELLCSVWGLLELAMVRWYQAVEPDAEEAELRMQKVQWETIGAGRSLCKERYDLIDIRSIQ